MLVLNRRVGEVIVIPPYQVTLTVLEVQGNRVRLGVTAPRNVSIHRQEIWERVQAMALYDAARAAQEMTPSGKASPTGVGSRT